MGASLMRVFSLLGALLPAWSLADTSLVYDESGQTNVLRIAEGRMRFDNHANRNWFLYDAARQAVIIVDPTRQEFSLLDQKTVAELRQTYESISQQVNTQMAMLPPAWRQQMEHIAGQGLPSSTPREYLNLRSTERRAQAAGHSCAVFQLLQKGKPKSEICLASAAQLGLPEADLATVRRWGGFSRSLAAEARGYLTLDDAVFGRGDQLPLMYRVKLKGNPGVLTEIHHQNIDPQLMEVPAGYHQRRLTPLG